MRIGGRLFDCSLILLLIGTLLTGAALAQKRGAAKRAQKSKVAAQVREAEQLLADLGYWVVSIDGRVDQATRHALIAFQKVEGRPRTGRLTVKELRALRAAQRPAPRENKEFHIEIDLSRQVLFVVDGEGKVSRILPVSSGNGKLFESEGWEREAITPTGRFRVHHKIEGMRVSPLGELYYPIYYLSGIAIHGNPAVPTRPASHGCVRIPMFAAKELNEMTPLGTTVLVYGDNQIGSRPQSSSRQN